MILSFEAPRAYWTNKLSFITMCQLMFNQCTWAAKCFTTLHTNIVRVLWFVTASRTACGWYSWIRT